MLNRIMDIATSRWRRVFPERQIYVRSHGQVRYVTLPPLAQFTAVLAVIMSAIWVSIASVSLIFKDEMLAARDRQISEIQGAYAGVNAEIAQIQRRFLATTLELETKHRQLAGLVGLPAAMPQKAPQASGDKAPAASPGNVPPAGGAGKRASGAAFDGNVRALEARLSSIKDEQSGMIYGFAKDAETTVVALEQLIAKTGLDVNKLVSRSANASPAAGGPLIPFPVSGAADMPAFQNLSASIGRLEILRAALFRLPLAAPVGRYYVSSGYGYRRDPFTRARAFHSGVDLVAPRGDPVYASAPGIVIFAGRNGPYGNMVEIDHGQGIHSRYGHLSKINVVRGNKLIARDLVGLVGSTGRSGTPHLHYEVLLDGKTRNPANFMKTGQDVFQRQG